MLEDKTTETRQDEPAGAPQHTGFRAKLRSLWAQLQCVHLLRRHRRYRRRRHRLDNAARKLRSSKLVLRVGAVLYALGFGAEYAAVRVGRAVKYAALWAAGGIRRFAKALAETAFPGAAQVAKDLFGPIVLFAKGTVSLLIHAHRIRREQGFGAAFEASVHYFKNGVRRNLSLLPRMAMYALPICALALGAAVFQYVIHQPYALAVRVNGETVGYVANEDVFNTAREDVLERISYAGTDKTEWTIEPSYTLAIAHHMMDENEMANAIIQSAGDQISEGTALYLDGELTAVCSNGKALRDYLATMLDPYEEEGDDPNVSVGFNKQVIDICDKAAETGEYNIGLVVCGLNAAYIQRTDEEFIAEVSKYYAKVEPVNNLREVLDYVDEKFLKLAIFDFEPAEPMAKDLLAGIEQPYEYVLSGKHWADIMDSRVSKGDGVVVLQKALGVGVDETAVFGDYLNDVPMFEHARYSFAVANAHPQVRAAAAYIAPANTEEGVIRVVDRIVR